MSTMAHDAQRPPGGDDAAARGARVKRTALLLGLVALAFYLAFIALTFVQSRA